VLRTLADYKNFRDENLNKNDEKLVVFLKNLISSASNKVTTKNPPFSGGFYFYKSKIICKSHFSY